MTVPTKLLRISVAEISVAFRATLIDRGGGTGAKRIMITHPERGEFIRRLTGWEFVEPGTLTLSTMRFHFHYPP
jgi:hypothetical protein